MPSAVQAALHAAQQALTAESAAAQRAARELAEREGQLAAAATDAALAKAAAAVEIEHMRSQLHAARVRHEPCAVDGLSQCAEAEYCAATICRQC